MELSKENIDDNILKKLAKLGFRTIDDLLLETNPFDIVEKTDLPLRDIEKLYQLISDSYVRSNCPIQPLITPALSATTNNDNENNNKISVGCDVLNRKLGGGLYHGGIYELFGECGSGKTQLCLQISANLIHSNLSSYICYICTDDAFPITRLCQLLQQRYHHTSDISCEFLDRILIYHAVDLYQVCDCMAKIEKKIHSFPIHLIIVDSIAGCARLTSQNEPYTTQLRTKYFALFKRLFSGCLKTMNDIHNQPLTLIAINHVVDNYDEGVKVGIGPSLGLSWSNILNTRIFLKRLYPLDHDQSQDMSVLMEESSNRATTMPFEAIEGIPRILKVVFSSHHSTPTHCLFTINQNGINGTNTVL